MDREAGFTLIELITVIVIIGVLLSIVSFTSINTLAGSRDSERADDTASIARLLEGSYLNQDSGTPSYPTITTFKNDIANKTGSARTADVGMFKAPNATSSSVDGAPTKDMPGSNSSWPSLNQYLYQPLTATGDLCSSSPAVCVRYRLFYRTEITKSIVTVNSGHQQ